MAPDVTRREQLLEGTSWEDETDEVPDSASWPDKTDDLADKVILVKLVSNDGKTYELTADLAEANVAAGRGTCPDLERPKLRAWKAARIEQARRASAAAQPADPRPYFLNRRAFRTAGRGMPLAKRLTRPGRRSTERRPRDRAQHRRVRRRARAPSRERPSPRRPDVAATPGSSGR